MKVVKTRIDAVYMDKWKRSWRALRNCRQSKFWLHKLDAKKASCLMRMSRPLLARMIQVITGFNNLAYHSLNKGDIEDDSCRLCGQQREEFIHLARDCVRLNGIREKCFGIWGPAGNWRTEDLEKFANDPKVKFLLDNRPGDPDGTIIF